MNDHNGYANGAGRVFNGSSNGSSGGSPGAGVGDWTTGVGSSSDANSGDENAVAAPGAGLVVYDLSAATGDAYNPQEHSPPSALGIPDVTTFNDALLSANTQEELYRFIIRGIFHFHSFGIDVWYLCRGIFLGHIPEEDVQRTDYAVMAYDAIKAVKLTLPSPFDMDRTTASWNMCFGLLPCFLRSSVMDRSHLQGLIEQELAVARDTMTAVNQARYGISYHTNLPNLEQRLPQIALRLNGLGRRG